MIGPVVRIYPDGTVTVGGPSPWGLDCTYEGYNEMHPHYVVIEDFIDTFGEPHVVGDVIVIGDSTPIEVLYEVTLQVEAGNLREVQAGEGVSLPVKHDAE